MKRTPFSAAIKYHFLTGDADVIIELLIIELAKGEWQKRETTLILTLLFVTREFSFLIRVTLVEYVLLDTG